MTAKLNQVIAIEKGVKSRVYSHVSDLHKVIQKPALFSGFAKNYTAKDDDGEDLPPERQRVQFNVQDVLRSVSASMSELIDVTAKKDWTNCVARGDVVVDDVVLVKQAPVSFLLFLEKQLSDMRAFVDNIPLLDEAESWTRDPNSGLARTEAITTHRTKKLQKPIVLYDATDKHPAQTQLITEDAIVGFWNLTKQSGAMAKPDRQALAQRVEKLIKAVKVAREAANMQDVERVDDIGSQMFDYLLPE